ncbi:putative YigZ family protein [Tamilnaduibacter salinus]|uniref:YigZ family protein n=1 Tax=Tamilnaduibacter salinus TaxID=1484056 RepID=A0A2A2I3X0_9GAMM|nr:YigZ family protein [Tamilnaduibacter salinus]PAV25800.1 YigZ family protein [Tamilnaduibacter salinus]PVY75781.1 putative YigZ family protein [Tamilnaduibacter salinus]
MATAYPIPAAAIERETVVRKSRFIARIARVTNRDEAMTFLDQARLDHPDARHHCWAYQIGAPESATQAAMNDDGEPSGTAGKPILGVIQHKNLGDVMVVVIRYFGGIKLGAGGLVRAYAGAAESVLSAVPTEERQPRSVVELTMGFADEQPVRLWCQQNGADVLNVDYGQGVLMQVGLPTVLESELRSFCQANGIERQAETE